MSCPTNRIKLIEDSVNQFTIHLVDECGKPVSLSAYTAGNLVFCNEAGIRTVIPLTVPGANPDKGQLAVTISSVLAADMDCKWKDADVELTSAGPETTIIPLDDMFEIVERNCPPIVP